MKELPTRERLRTAWLSLGFIALTGFVFAAGTADGRSQKSAQPDPQLPLIRSTRGPDLFRATALRVMELTAKAMARRGRFESHGSRSNRDREE